MDKLIVILHDWNIVSILARLMLSVACGGVVGLFRSVRRRGAGFKTHVLVCMGSCLVSMTGLYVYYNLQNAGDVTRLPANVIVGVGFLGAGTILVTGKRHIKGLTTAAGLWTSAAIGVALGFGFYSGALAATLILVFIYGFFEDLDDKIYSHSKMLDLYVEFSSKKAVGDFVRDLRQKNYKIVMMELDRDIQPGEGFASAMLELEAPEKRPHDIVIGELLKLPGVDYIEEI